MFWEITGDNLTGDLVDAISTGNPPLPDLGDTNSSGSPGVAISDPLDCGLSFEGFNLVINAEASDPDDDVTKVEFFQGSTSLGYDTKEPFSWAHPLLSSCIRCVSWLPL